MKHISKFISNIFVCFLVFYPHESHQQTTGCPTGVNQLPESCMPGWSQIQLKCFKLMTPLPKLNWEAAKQDCISRGGSLASIFNTCEDQLAAGLTNGKETWIGGSDSGKEGTFIWEETGYAFYINGAFPGVYSNFGATQPSHFTADSEDCLSYMATTGYWEDASCTLGRQHLCQMTAVVGAATATPPTTYAQDPQICSPFVLFATCDNTLEVFVDGIKHSNPQDSNWQYASRVDMNQVTCKQIAVSCKDDGHAFRGLLTSTDKGWLTEQNWVCKDREEPGWKLADFEDTCWTHPQPNVQNKALMPWGHIQNINNNSKWMWIGSRAAAAGGPNTMYCRLKTISFMY